MVSFYDNAIIFFVYTYSKYEMFTLLLVDMLTEMLGLHGQLLMYVLKWCFVLKHQCLLYIRVMKHI